jgi:hypothetical protein
MPLAARLAHSEHQPDRLRTQTARDEGQRLRGGRVEPLRVVHDADKRSVFRNVRQQTQHRQADEEPIRRGAVPQTERGAKRIALRAGKALQAIHERCAQLLQPCVREFHLRLDTDRPGNAAPGRVLRQILQQRALAGPGLPAQHQRPARTRAHARHQLIQCCALAASAQQPPRWNRSRHCHQTEPRNGAPRWQTSAPWTRDPGTGHPGVCTRDLTGRDGQARRPPLVTAPARGPIEVFLRKETVTPATQPRRQP